MKITIILIVLLLSSVTCLADDVFVVIMKKQQEKRARGFDLLGWMQTKKKIALMDQWLALNSSASSYEFFFDGDRSKYTLDQNSTSSDHVLLRGNVGFYATIFGFEAEYEKSNEKYESKIGIVGLRLLGIADQSTNLVTYLGYRDMDLTTMNENHTNTFVGLRSNIYINSFLGINGNVRKYLTNTTEAIESDGLLTEYGAFIDLFFLRLTWTYFTETTNYKRSGVSTTDTRDGTRINFTLYM
jgi:hypothetical protein